MLFSILNSHMEYIYRLNLPTLPHLILDSVSTKLEHNPDHPIVERYDAYELIKPEWLTINGYQWTSVVYFYKPTNFVGKIHRDSDNFNEMPWAINWIYGGTGVLSYYLPESIPEPVAMINHMGYPVLKYAEMGNDTHVPEKKYVMEQGAYLVNASIPHLPSSLGQRHCVSVRSDASYNIPWERVVDSFEHYII